MFENKLKNQNKYFGRDEHFNSVIVESSDNLTSKIIDIKILSANQSTLFGEIISDLYNKEFALKNV